MNPVIINNKVRNNIGILASRKYETIASDNFWLLHPGLKNQYELRKMVIDLIKSEDSEALFFYAKNDEIIDLFQDER